MQPSPAPNPPSQPSDDKLHARLLPWFYQHGRHDLPWQQLHSERPNPYPVWISEVMLQQTQVATVKDYYARFMARFPTLADLANAPIDDVLSLWAGLGYYARARHLHRTAIALIKIIEKTGAYPQTVAEWQALHGIGRSTAGAIVAMGLGGFGVICDGNVKRVLTRHFAIADDISNARTEKALWALASTHTPEHNSGHYAQAMMDLGATLCSKSKPKCTLCPIHSTCQAHLTNSTHIYPVKVKKQPKPTHSSHALIIRHQGRALWLKRPPSGLWGGLWCLPLVGETLPLSLDERLISDILSTHIAEHTSEQPSIRHSLTHFHWQLLAMVIDTDDNTAAHIERALHAAASQYAWHKQPPAARPTAIKKLGALITGFDGV